MRNDVGITSGWQSWRKFLSAADCLCDGVCLHGFPDPTASDSAGANRRARRTKETLKRTETMREFSRLPRVRSLSETKGGHLRPFARRYRRIGLYRQQRFLLREYLGSRNTATCGRECRLLDEVRRRQFGSSETKLMWDGGARNGEKTRQIQALAAKTGLIESQGLTG